MFFLLLAALLLAPAGGNAQTSSSEETLRYTVNWPSGLSLGEGSLIAKRSAAGGWELALELEAGIPGFQVLDRFLSAASPEYCSLHFEKESVHGKRQAREKTVFEGGMATRTTLGGGGKSEFPVPACARDALAFLFHLRQEIAQGRIPPAQTVYFGAPYEVRLDYKGVQAVQTGETPEKADRLAVSAKGPSSKFSLEIFLARDPARTPLAIKVPLELGTFSMELVR